MRLLIKVTVAVFFLCASLENKAQPFNRSSSHPSYKLIATNGKQTRRYFDDNVLKIWYHKNGGIVKVKGRLFVDSVGAVELLPYGRKPLAVISTDSIVSISRWHRNGKIALVVLAGAGLALGAVASIASARSAGMYESYSVLPLIFAGIDLYYLTIATPIVFISEWLSVRSEKQGYHFYVE